MRCPHCGENIFKWQSYLVVEGKIYHMVKVVDGRIVCDPDLTNSEITEEQKNRWKGGIP